MASARFEPTNLGTKGQHATPRPPKPILLILLHFMTIPPEGTELFHVDRRTDRQTRQTQESLCAILRTHLKTVTYNHEINIRCEISMVTEGHTAPSSIMTPCSYPENVSNLYLNTWYPHCHITCCHSLEDHKINHT